MIKIDYAWKYFRQITFLNRYDTLRFSIVLHLYIHSNWYKNYIHCNVNIIYCWWYLRNVKYINWYIALLIRKEFPVINIGGYVRPSLIWNNNSINYTYKERTDFCHRHIDPRIIVINYTLLTHDYNVVQHVIILYFIWTFENWHSITHKTIVEIAGTYIHKN